MEAREIKIKTILKVACWIAAFVAAMYGIIYAFWLVLFFMLFHDGRMWLALAAEVVSWGIYFWLIKIL